MIQQFSRRLFTSIGMGGALCAVVVAQVVPPRKAAPQSAATGEQLWKRQCASCHGAQGEGGAGYPRALAGTQTAAQLARYIAGAMPPGPKHASAPDARTIAGYAYDAFYSPIAQERNRPARVALSRMTVRQLRNAVGDLVASFRPAPPLPAERGLKAAYFKARNFSNNEMVMARMDNEVRFDFGTAGPAPDKFDPHQFSIRWEGSLLPPDSGEYELVVRSDHSVRLWINDQRKPLIDAWVKSGKDTEFRAPIYLIGGRAYALRLEFSKSTQGVDDTKDQDKRPVPPAFITLAWRRPHLDEEPIPGRCLAPESRPEAYVVETPFPPDDRSIGYERGNSVSKAWDEAGTTAALETSRYIAAHLNELAGTRDDAPDRREKLMAFSRTFVERAFRRPLNSELTSLYIDRQFKVAPDLETAVRRVVVLALKSPRFLYNEPDAADGYAVASRLALALWDSLPDETLLKAAGAGDLATREGVQKQAERMAADPRAWGKLREFLLSWLRVDQFPDLAKDPKKFPGFDARAAADLRTSLELFLESTVGGEKADFRELLLSDQVFLNGRLAKVYGVDLPADAPFQPVKLDASERAGVLTQPYILASFAYIGATSPIHRGVLLARNVLGRTLAPPPVAVSPIAADLHPNLTTRQRVTLQTKPAACSTCHNMINPLGFPLERFDAIGKLRTADNGQPIDARGSYKTRSGETVAFDGARPLAQFLVNSEEVRTAFVEKLFQNLTKQPVRAYGATELPDLTRRFVADRYNVRALMAQMAVDAARYRPGKTERVSSAHP